MIRLVICNQRGGVSKTTTTHTLGRHLADQIEESLEQLTHETDHCHGAFLCKVLGMYSSQLETKHQGLGERIAEACQEIYVTIREHEIG